ncbi:MAG TPA: CapA family protein, partial [Thermomicrobiales bacterium]|nr:CapA family protein [Thermomicrobiales bacterium]
MGGDGKMVNRERGPLVVDFVGDFMLERRLEPDDVRATRLLFEGADAAIANLDTVLSDRGAAVPKWANLRGPRDCAHDLRAMGIDLVAMANNHAMDFRAEGMLDACRALDDADVRHAGTGADLAAASAPVVVETRNGALAVLSIACTLPPESAAGPDSPGIAPVHVRYAFAVDEALMPEQPGTVPGVWTELHEPDVARARQDIAAARTAADAVVVVVHWGVPAPWRAPAHPILQSYQRRLGRVLIDAGADAVLGNHAHELHGIELYQGRPIAYCLGNFWIDTIAAYPWMGRESMVFRLTLGDGVVTGAEVVPLLLDAHGVPRSDPSARSIAILNEQSREFGVTVDAVDGRWIVT